MTSLSTKSRRRRSIIIPWERPPAWVAWASGGWGRSIVLGLLLLIIAVLAMRHQKRIERTRATRVTVAAVRQATVRFKFDAGRCPQGIRELLHPPAGEAYLRDLPLDGWGRWFSYRCPGRKNPDSADVRSRGPDGTWWGRDEIE